MRNLKRAIFKTQNAVLRKPFRWWRAARAPLATPSSDAVGVLLRGQSLARMGELAYLDQFIIVNRFGQELKMEPIKSTLRGKQIIHMVNSVETVLPPRQLFTYHIERYQLSQLAPNGSAQWWRQPRRRQRPEAWGYKAQYLPETLEPWMTDVPNTGVLAIAFAVLGLGKKQVYIAGLDFYDKGYLIKTKPLARQLEREPSLADVGEFMKIYLNRFISAHPTVQFHFLTDSHYQPKLPNVTIYGSGQTLAAAERR